MYIEGMELANQLLRDIERTKRMNEEAMEELLNGGKSQSEERIVVFYNNPIPKVNVGATA